MPTYLCKINSTEIYNIKKYTVSLPKLSTDSGRSMNGDLHTTHLGIYPKIGLEFKPMTEAEVRVVGALINNPSFTLQWWNPISNSYKTGTFYAGDTDFNLMRRGSGDLYESFKVNLIAFNKLT